MFAAAKDVRRKHTNPGIEIILGLAFALSTVICTIAAARGVEYAKLLSQAPGESMSSSA